MLILAFVFFSVDVCGAVSAQSRNCTCGGLSLRCVCEHGVLRFIIVVMLDAIVISVVIVTIIIIIIIVMLDYSYIYFYSY